jgi:hypothetical protein
VSFEWSFFHLYLVVQRFPGLNDAIPHPQRVAEIYEGLLKGGLGKRLSTRKSGRSSETDNLVPPIVGFFLRTYGCVESPKEIHRLLNEHVLGGGWRQKLPEDGTSTSASTQLWANVKRVHRQLVRTMHSL